MQTVFSACFILVILSVYAKEVVVFCFVFILFFICIIQYAAMLDHLLPKRGLGVGGGGGMAHDILILFPAYDVTDTDCWA